MPRKRPRQQQDTGQRQRSRRGTRKPRAFVLRGQGAGQGENQSQEEAAVRSSGEEVALSRHRAESTLADHFERLSPQLRGPSLVNLYARCNHSERMLLFALRFGGLRTHSGQRGAQLRHSLAVRCLQHLRPASAAELPRWIAELQHSLEQESRASGLWTQGAVSVGTTVPNIKSDAGNTTHLSPNARAVPCAKAAGPSVETQTPTGLTQLLLADTFAEPCPSPADTAEMQTQTLMPLKAWGEEAATQTSSFTTSISIETSSDLLSSFEEHASSAFTARSVGTSPLRIETMDLYRELGDE